MSQAEREVWLCLIGAVLVVLASLIPILRCWKNRTMKASLSSVSGAFLLPSLVLAATSVCWLAGGEGLKEDGGEFLIILFPGGLLLLSGIGAVLGGILTCLVLRCSDNRSVD